MSTDDASPKDVKFPEKPEDAEPVEEDPMAKIARLEEALRAKSDEISTMKNELVDVQAKFAIAEGCRHDAETENFLYHAALRVRSRALQAAKNEMTDVQMKLAASEDRCQRLETENSLYNGALLVRSVALNEAKNELVEVKAKLAAEEEKCKRVEEENSHFFASKKVFDKAVARSRRTENRNTHISPEISTPPALSSSSHRPDKRTASDHTSATKRRRTSDSTMLPPAVPVPSPGVPSPVVQQQLHSPPSTPATSSVDELRYGISERDLSESIFT